MRALVFGVPPEPIHVLDLVVDGRVDLRPMLTHTFRLQQWREAFLAIANQGESGAVKVAIDQG